MTAAALLDLLSRVPPDTPVVVSVRGRYVPARASVGRVDPITGRWNDDAPDALIVEPDA
jgi:hypothetical protein